MDDETSIKTYIRQELSRGVDSGALKSRIKAYGYDPSVVDRAIAEGKSASNTVVQQTAQKVPVQTAPAQNSGFQNMGFFGKIKTILLDPKKFFDLMPQTGGYSGPLTFAFTILLIVGIINVLVSLALGKIGDNMILAVGTPVIMGIVGTLAILFFALFTNGALRLFGGKGTYEATVRVASYTMAADIVSWVPLVGAIVSLYGTYIAIVGYMKVHQLSAGRVIGAMLLLFIIALIIIGAILYLLWDTLRGMFLENTALISGLGSKATGAILRTAGF